MTQSLDFVNMTPETAPSADLLVHVKQIPDQGLRLDEKIAVRTAHSISPHITYVFFRQFDDTRSSQVAAYVVDNSNNIFAREALAELHRAIWLSGQTPLLYVGYNGKVEIYSCASVARLDGQKNWIATPVEIINIASNVEAALEKEKAKRFSSYNLLNGTFWEDERNSNIVNRNGAAHKALISKVEYADKKLRGDERPEARHLLLLTLLLKYLEDRKVFDEYSKETSDSTGEWFSSFHPEARSCLHVFKYGGKSATLKMFEALEKKFNGDIFSISSEHLDSVTDSLLSELVDLVCTNLDSRTRQLYLWDFYSFEHIPVEVLSHIYQHFADRAKGAVFTPPLLVNAMLDRIMPLDGSLTAKETVLDPTCGSGIFLVSAFRRIVHTWCDRNEWRQPHSKDLTELLSRTIFGIEWQEQAAELTAFSLALAVCDALRPDIIWNELRFDKLIGHNILVGDYCSHIDALKQKTPGGKGFDIIVGNPPFLSELTTLMKERACDCDIPDSQAAYFFLIDCTTKALAPSGNICILQHYGFLYNKNTENFRKKYISECTVLCVLDFVSIGGLFKGASVKVIAIHATNSKPSKKHLIQHWTFRRTFAVDSLVGFDLDYYDYHDVQQQMATENDWIWRVNLFGGGRLFHIVKRLSGFPTILDYCKSKKWRFSEGYSLGKKLKQANWLCNKQLLTEHALPVSATKIDPAKLSTVGEETYFERPRSEETFTPPLFIIREHTSLPCAYWGANFLAYTNEFVGIKAENEDSVELKSFADKFIDSRHLLTAFIQLTSHRAITTRATVVYKSDIERLPCPSSSKWNISQWEKELIDDVNIYMSEFIRLGQDSTLLSKRVTKDDSNVYTDTFLRLVKKMYPQLVLIAGDCSGGMMYQAFSFRGIRRRGWWNNKNWLSELDNIIYSSHGDTKVFHSIRVLRIFDDDLLIIVKPDKLRYWIRSTAIRDADDIIKDIMRGSSDDI